MLSHSLHDNEVIAQSVVALIFLLGGPTLMEWQAGKLRRDAGLAPGE